MKFSCTQENLNQGLMVVSHIASRNVNLPILGNVLVKCDDGAVKLMSTNLEIAISCTVRGKISEPGEFTVPSKLFSDYVSLLSKERIDVSLDGSALEVSCGNYRTKLNGVPATEFPLVPSIDQQHQFRIKVADLRKAIGQVLFAVAPNESRPEISGVLFRFSPEKDGVSLTLAATDSYRLAERKFPVSAGGGTDIGEPISVIVPSRTVAELTRVLSVFKDNIDSPMEITVLIGDNQVLFSYNSVELISRTIEGKYPDYRQLIPESFNTEVKVSKEELQRAIRATSLFSRTGLNDIHISFRPGGVVNVRAANSQTGEHNVEMDGNVSGKENDITVNYKYLLDGVNNIESENVGIKLIDGTSPCMLGPNTEDGAATDYLYIVMPIRQ